MEEFDLKPVDSVVKKPVWKGLKIPRYRVDEYGNYRGALPDSIGFIQYHPLTIN
jgi:hypothetical protein